MCNKLIFYQIEKYQEKKRRLFTIKSDSKLIKVYLRR